MVLTIFSKKITLKNDMIVQEVNYEENRCIDIWW